MGMVTLASETQSAKAKSPMVVTLLGITMEVILVPWKAPMPILVTVLGIVMLVTPETKLKAKFPMLVTAWPLIVLGILKVAPVPEKPVMLMDPSLFVV